jgi:hypothetical protein
MRRRTGKQSSNRLAERELDAGLDPAELPAQVGGMRRSARTPGLKPRRSEFAGGVANRANDEMPLAVLKNVLGRVCVDLRFAIAPATAAEIVIPLERIGRRARGTEKG